MECRACMEGTILENGHCDLCGLNELQFVMEWDEWTDSLEAYQEYVERLAA